MNLYIVPAWYPQNENDVTAIFFREQAQALAERGHNVTVIHIEPVSVTQCFSKPWHSERVWQDGNVRTIFHKVIVPIPAKIGKIQDKYISNIFYKILKEQIKKDLTSGLSAPDLIHAHVSHSCAYYCIKASEKLSLPLVVTEHYSGLLLGTASEKDYARVAETINKSDAFIFVGSRFQETLCERLGIDKQTNVVFNMVDTDAYSIVDNHDGGTFTFLSACHLTENKSVDLVIKAFNKAFEKNTPVRLTIAGDGIARNSLESLVSELGETERISFFGRYTKEQAKEIFADSDAFVLTSKVETFGIVYLEALSNGIPCIATKGQGAEDIITESNGFKVEYGDIDELADRMKYLYENQNKYDRTYLRNDCIERFGKDSICSQIESIYKSVSSNNI